MTSARPSSGRERPSRDRESHHGHPQKIVVGIDEVGKGAWAGPLVVGAAVLPRERRVNGVRDSKALSEKQREEMFDRVADWCEAWSIGAASHAECDELGMAGAQRLATRRALDALGVVPDARDRDSVAALMRATFPALSASEIAPVVNGSPASA